MTRDSYTKKYIEEMNNILDEIRELGFKTVSLDNSYLKMAISLSYIYLNYRTIPVSKEDKEYFSAIGCDLTNISEEMVRAIIRSVSEGNFEITDNDNFIIRINDNDYRVPFECIHEYVKNHINPKSKRFNKKAVPFYNSNYNGEELDYQSLMFNTHWFNIAIRFKEMVSVDQIENDVLKWFEEEAKKCQGNYHECFEKAKKTVQENLIKKYPGCVVTFYPLNGKECIKLEERLKQKQKYKDFDDFYKSSLDLTTLPIRIKKLYNLLQSSQSVTLKKEELDLLLHIIGISVFLLNKHLKQENINDEPSEEFLLAYSKEPFKKQIDKILSILRKESQNYLIKRIAGEEKIELIDPEKLINPLRESLYNISDTNGEMLSEALQTIKNIYNSLTYPKTDINLIERFYLSLNVAIITYFKIMRALYLSRCEKHKDSIEIVRRALCQSEGVQLDGNEILFRMRDGSKSVIGCALCSIDNFMYLLSRGLENPEYTIGETNESDNGQYTK